MYKQHYTIKKELHDYMESSREFITNQIKAVEEVNTLLTMPKDELILHVNDHKDGSPLHHVLTSRLKDEDPFETNLSLMIQVLWDEEFSYEDYRDIGKNDATIEVIAHLSNILGDEDTAAKAYEALYSE